MNVKPFEKGGQIRDAKFRGCWHSRFSKAASGFKYTEERPVNKVNLRGRPIGWSPGLSVTLFFRFLGSNKKYKWLRCFA